MSKTLRYTDFIKSGEPRKYWLALPKQLQDDETWVDQNKMVWYRLPKDVYESKKYPICPQCKRKFVPSGYYKRCLQCRKTLA